MFSAMDIACFHKTKNNTLFHFQKLTDDCKIAMSALVVFTVFLHFLKM